MRDEKQRVREELDQAQRESMKYWEIIADNLKKRGWSLGWVSAIDSNGRTIWIADAHRDDGKRFIVRADEKLTAFLELEAAIRGELLKDSKLRYRGASAPQAALHWRRRV